MAKLQSEDQQYRSYIDLVPGKICAPTDQEALLRLTKPEPLPSKLIRPSNRWYNGAASGAREPESWQSFSLVLKNGNRSVKFAPPPRVQGRYKRAELEGDENRAHPTTLDEARIQLADGSFLARHPGDTGAKGYVFCRAPKDEVSQLIALLKRLAERKVSHVRFETLEPSIELEITRQSSEEEGSLIEGTVSQISVANSNVEDDGLKVQLFVDAGNVETEISRWDALGIRFFSTQAHLEQFIEALQKEFGC